MEVKDNAYEQTQTGTIAEAKVGLGDAPTQVPTDLGKFKDVGALLKAYDSLQAEFTKRSQRLKELERQVEQFGDGTLVSGVGGVEKLKTRAAERKQETQKFDAFVRDLERESTELNSTAEGLEEQDENGKEIVGVDDKNGASVAKQTPTISPDDLFDLVNRDESVRLKVIGDYLASLKTTGAPLMRGGAGLCVSPTIKAKSIDEAGAMALRFFKKENVL